MNNMLLGAVAGACGTLALDITSYADMALRGRSASNVPADVVRRIAEKVGIEALSKPDEMADDKTKNRRVALGAILGYLTGLTVGAAYGAAHPLFEKAPIGCKAFLAGSVAMAASAVPATLLGTTDPKQWGTSGWLADIVPHAMYGLITAAVFEAIATP